MPASAGEERGEEGTRDVVTVVQPRAVGDPYSSGRQAELSDHTVDDLHAGGRRPTGALHAAELFRQQLCRLVVALGQELRDDAAKWRRVDGTDGLGVLRSHSRAI